MPNLKKPKRQLYSTSIRTLPNILCGHKSLLILAINFLTLLLQPKGNEHDGISSMCLRINLLCTVSFFFLKNFKYFNTENKGEHNQLVQRISLLLFGNNNTWSQECVVHVTLDWIFFSFFLWKPDYGHHRRARRTFLSTKHIHLLSKPVDKEKTFFLLTLNYR